MSVLVHPDLDKEYGNLIMDRINDLISHYIINYFDDYKAKRIYLSKIEYVLVEVNFTGTNVYLSYMENFDDLLSTGVFYLRYPRFSFILNKNDLLSCDRDMKIDTILDF